MGITKITSAQQQILNQMRRGYALISHMDTKYRSFNMPAEHGGYLLNTASCAMKPVLLSTIKAMLGKNLIAEEKRYVSSDGFCGEHQTERWRIHYKLNLCIHCYEQPASDQFNGMFCAACANEMGEQWETEQNERVKEMAQ
jgi:hypothetical protein